MLEAIGTIANRETSLKLPNITIERFVTVGVCLWLILVTGSGFLSQSTNVIRWAETNNIPLVAIILVPMTLVTVWLILTMQLLI